MTHDVLSEQLTALQAGQRAWFVFSEALGEADALQLAPLSDDPHAEHLTQRLAGHTTGHGVRPLFGLCQVGEDGVLDFGAEDIGEAELTRMATWAKAQATERPALQRLYGARGLVLTRRHEVEYVLDLPALWEGLLPPTAPGTLGESCDTLQSLVPGQKAWFWATDKGPGGQPMLLVEPIRKGETIQAIQRRVEGVVRRSEALGRITRGLLVCEVDGSLTLETVTPEAQHGRVLGALGKADRRLRWMRRPQDPPAEDLDQTASLLEGLTEDDMLHALLVAHPRGETTFHLARDPEGLSRWQGGAEDDRLEHATGALRLDGAQVELILAQPFRHVIPRLARWVACRYLDHVSVVRLYQMRVITPDAVEPLTQDEAWAFL